MYQKITILYIYESLFLLFNYNILLCIILQTVDQVCMPCNLIHTQSAAIKLVKQETRHCRSTCRVYSCPLFILTRLTCISDCTNQGFWTAWTSCSVTCGEGITTRACLHLRRTPSNKWNFTALFWQNQTCTIDLCYGRQQQTAGCNIVLFTKL